MDPKPYNGIKEVYSEHANEIAAVTSLVIILSGHLGIGTGELAGWGAGVALQEPLSRIMQNRGILHEQGTKIMCRVQFGCVALGMTAGKVTEYLVPGMSQWPGEALGNAAAFIATTFTPG